MDLAANKETQAAEVSAFDCREVPVFGRSEIKTGFHASTLRPVVQEDEIDAEVSPTGYDFLDKFVPVVMVVLLLTFVSVSCFWLPIEAYSVMSNTTTAMHCAAQNFAHMVTARCLTQLQSACQRNADMLKNGVVRCN